MSKTIYICEFCGHISTQFFNQCKFCETYQDGVKYKLYDKEEVKRMSREEFLTHIKLINEFIDNQDFIDEKMDNELLQKELEKSRKHFTEKLDSIKEEIFKLLNIKKKDSNNLSTNLDKEWWDNLSRMHNSMEHKSDNEINKKIIEEKLSENKKLQSNVDKRLEEIKELNSKLIKSQKENRKLNDELDKERKSQLSFDNYQMMKKEIDTLERKLEQLKKDDNIKPVKTKKQIVKKTNENTWTDVEVDLLIKLYKKFIKNKDNRVVVIANKVVNEFSKQGFDRNDNAIKKKIYRLKQKKLI